MPSLLLLYDGSEKLRRNKNMIPNYKQLIYKVSRMETETKQNFIQFTAGTIGTWGVFTWMFWSSPNMGILPAALWALGFTVVGILALLVIIFICMLIWEFLMTPMRRWVDRIVADEQKRIEKSSKDS